MGELLQIQDFVQEIAQATSLALNLNVEIIDIGLLRIAGTGVSKDKIGKHFRKKGIVNRYIFEGTNTAVVTSPGIDTRCSQCDLYGCCDTKAAVYSAIIVENTTIGAFGILAHTENQALLIDENNKGMLDFVNSMATLISSKIRENRIVSELKSSLKFNQLIMDNINKGVIILDSSFDIKNANNYILEKLDIKKSDLINNPIRNFFKNFDIESFENEKDIDIFGELDYKYSNKHLKFVYKTKLIIVDDDIESIVLIIDDKKDIFRIAAQIEQNNKSITFDDIISCNSNFNNFKNTMKDVSRYESTMLLIGETGTGKELFAHAIHSNSSRKLKPLIIVDCGAIPENLIESELFGYEKGAFTGASSDGKKGKFHLANKGTIFLDELENMPLYLQQKLLRVLEQRTIEPLGSTKIVHIDVRIIAATNKNLKDLVVEGKLREDLYHRLNVIPFNIPPLRERGDDVLILTNHFIKKYNERFNKDILGITPEVKSIFKKHTWKGNIRELQNAIEYSVTLCKHKYIDIKDLPFHIKNSVGSKKINTLKEVENNHIRNTLNKFGMSEKGKLEAAKCLGISRATIYRKIKELGIND